jgi:hypothetical protein
LSQEYKQHLQLPEFSKNIVHIGEKFNLKNLVCIEISILFAKDQRKVKKVFQDSINFVKLGAV